MGLKFLLVFEGFVEFLGSKGVLWYMNSIFKGYFSSKKEGIIQGVWAK